MVLLALLLLQTAAPSAEADRLFQLGTALAAEGDTTGARAAFDGALATGWASAAADHNLGTLALAQGDLGRARLHLERAARHGLSAQTAQNLRLVRERVGVPDPTDLERAWRGVTGRVGAGGLVGLALLLTYGAVALAVVRRQRGGRGWAVGAWAAAGLAAVAVLGAVGALAEASRDVGVALVETSVHDAPGPDGSDAGRVRAGETVALGETVGGWRRLAAGQIEGWVPVETVERL